MLSLKKKQIRAYKILGACLAFSLAPTTPSFAGAPLLPLLDVTSTQTLEILDPNFHLGYFLESNTIWPSSNKSPSAQELFQKSPKYKSFVEQIEKDLHKVGATILSGVDGQGTADHAHQFHLRKPKDIPEGSTGMARNGAETSELELIGEGPRQLDLNWLKSPYARFNLVGLINRVDRLDFDRGDQSCGETRLIYRLSYEVPIDKFSPPEMVDGEKPSEGKKKLPSVQGPLTVKSTLPFVLNLILKNPKTEGKSCYDFVEKFWSPPENLNPGPQLAAYLSEGLLNSQSSQLKFQQLEVNFQGMRFSSAYNPDFAGQAMYFLRIFKLAPAGNSLEPVVLENTPNVLLLKQDEDLKKNFIAFIKKNIAAVDEGTFVADPEIIGKDALDTLAVSFSALGKVRRANKPYSDFLKAADFPDALFANTRFVKSGAGLIERLNNLSCMGCHQNGSTAGFHFLGAPSNNHNHFHNQTAIPFSPHYYADRLRRSKALGQMKERGLNPETKKEQHDRFRLLSIMPPAANLEVKIASQIKEACSMTARGQHFNVELECADKKNVSCLAAAEFVDPLTPTFFGECVPNPTSSGFVAGMACMKAKVEQSSGNSRDNTAVMGLLKKAKLPWNLMDFQDVAYSGEVPTGFQSNKVGFLTERLKTFTAPSITKDGRTYTCGNPAAGVPLGRTSTECMGQEDYDFTQIKHAIGFSNSKSSAELLAAIQSAKESKTLPKQYCGLRGSIAFSKCSERLDGPLCFDRLGSSRSMIDICYEGHFCREDYICQSLPENVINQITARGSEHGAPEDFLKKIKIDGQPAGQLSSENVQLLRVLRNQGVGFCTPTYFVLNMRIDGHPRPDGKMTGVHQQVKWPGKNPKSMNASEKSKVMQWYRGGYDVLNNTPYKGRHQRY